MKPTIRRLAVAGLAAICVFALLAVTAEGRQARRRRVTKHKIAPGVTFMKIVDKHPKRRTFVIRAEVATHEAALDVALAAAGLPARATVQRMANAHHALAAVNGDFTASSGRPTHPFAQDGNLIQTAAQRGPLFALSEDETTTFLGPPGLRVAVSNRQTDQTWRLDRWNQGPPAPGEIVGFSTYGGALEAPPDYVCSVRLLPEGGIAFDQDKSGVVADFTVDVAACSDQGMARNGGIVLSAQPATDEATQLLALPPGTPMRLRWTLGWTDVLDAVGGMPVLVQDGRVVAPFCTTTFCRRNPRTGIGVTAGGAILLVVVDGRHPKWSVGASIHEFGQIMRGLGAVQALNLDGGGSTTMVVKGDVVNRPSDGRQRHVSTSVLVLRGPDPGEA